MTSPRRPTDSEIDQACLWYRHDYGLLSPEEQEEVRAEAVGWLRAWIKVRDHEAPSWDPRRQVPEETARSSRPEVGEEVCPACGAQLDGPGASCDECGEHVDPDAEPHYGRGNAHE